MVQLIHAIISVVPFQHYITLRAFYRFLFVASVIFMYTYIYYVYAEADKVLGLPTLGRWQNRVEK